MKIKSNWLIIILSILLLTSCELPEDTKNSIQVNNVDLTTISNGTFEGEFKDKDSGGYSKVSVTVDNHKITEIKLLEFSASPVGRKGQYVLKSVIKEQRVNVDAVSGATLSSLVVLKSIEIALEKGAIKK